MDRDGAIEKAEKCGCCESSGNIWNRDRLVDREIDQWQGGMLMK